MGSYPAFSPLPSAEADGGLFSVALSVETAFADPSRVYPGLKTGLRGIAPCGVRTFLPGLAPGAILRPSEIENKLGPVRKRNKGGENSLSF